MRNQRPVFKSSTVMKRCKANKMPHNIKGGRYQCLHCHFVDLVCETESPMFHENGMYIYCPQCKQTTIHRVIFPKTEGYPEGFEIDLTGERKKYRIIA